MSERSTETPTSELEELKENLLLMGGTIESMMAEAEVAMSHIDAELAEKIIERDEQVDQMEKSIDELAISILSFRQPASRDLRFVTSSMKIITDIERMGDTIKNICERVSELSHLPRVSPNSEIGQLFRKSSELITKCLDGFVNFSSQEAGKTLALDHEIDQMHIKIYKELVEQMQKDPEHIPSLLKYLYIAKYLERIADHATNISEQVIFMVEGLDIRHIPEVAPTP